MVQVQVAEGVLEGELVHNEFGGSYYSFKGIPYAEPPVGDLRFQPPRPPKPWKGVRIAKNFGQICFQVHILIKTPPQGSEDCLYLNVYTPDLIPYDPLPVMFWIHGGAYVCGSGNDDNFGPEYLVKFGVIIVTINYRLEALGFLCLDTEEIPGNAGMKDQVAALKWVKANISNFGGDPNNVTIFGQSAGGSSVGYHLISPMSKGLFKRAIVQSGTATCWWSRSFEPRTTALALAKKLGFNSADDKALNKYFKHIHPKHLVDIDLSVILSTEVIEKYKIVFGVVDEKQFGKNERFFFGDLFDILQNGIHEGVEVVTGYTADEGILNMSIKYDYERIIEQANKYVEFFAPKHLIMNSLISEQIKASKRIKDFYFNDQTIARSDWRQLSKYFTMEMYVFDILNWVKTNCTKNKIYFYKFNCKSNRNVMALQTGLKKLIPDQQVVAHSDDLPYIFTSKIIGKVDMCSEEYKMINNVTKLWTNFARDGNPTPNDSLGVKWMPYKIKEQNYLNIDSKLEMETAPDDDQVKFWEELYKEYLPRFVYKEL
ncbi:hypothetical protein K1T71_001469 [Dendrolimus kikuchii]|uniref:Uncharacterized protein n=1 Tax=Dendrolimus kikuchii TaxID=765133 RepID=A0ACC1DIL4_9NEOP|nr:hypothetical protein K1T71_001469 [Dendrolimus kikuchii]